MAVCETTDYAYPYKADLYYPIVNQGAYGNLEKQWVFDRTIACAFQPVGSKFEEEVRPNANITKENILLGRTKKDIRVTSNNSKESITNIVITNIRTEHDLEIYMETSGPRSGRSTIYEIATLEPFVGPFQDIEYYKLVIRRSENQATDL
jgi:hypothetical protein